MAHFMYVTDLDDALELTSDDVDLAEANPIYPIVYNVSFYAIPVDMIYGFSIQSSVRGVSLTLSHS